MELVNAGECTGLYKDEVGDSNRLPRKVSGMKTIYESLQGFCTAACEVKRSTEGIMQ